MLRAMFPTIVQTATDRPAVGNARATVPGAGAQQFSSYDRRIDEFVRVLRRIMSGRKRDETPQCRRVGEASGRGWDRFLVGTRS